MSQDTLRPKRVSSIRHRLALSLFLGFFLVAVSIGFFQQYLSYVQFENYVKRSSEEALDIVIDYTDKWLTSQMNVAALLASKVETSLAVSPNVPDDFKNFSDANDLRLAYLGLEDGRYMDNHRPLFRDYPAMKSKRWYAETVEKRRSNLVIRRSERKEGQFVLTFASPVFDAMRTRVVGVAALDLSFDEMKKVLGSVFLPEVEAFLLFEGPQNETAIFVKIKDIPREHIEELAAAFKKGEVANNSMRIMAYNKYFITYQTLEIAGITIVYPISLTSLFTPLILQAIIFFIVTVLCLWLVTKLAWRSIRNFVTRIEVLNQTAQKISSGNFDINVRQTTNDEIGQLGDSFNKMIGSLKNYMSTLETTIREKESMSKEMEIASHVQQNALPRKMPSIQGLEIMAQSDPAKAVGGDYYDFLFPEPDKLICVIADVSGKGLPSSLYMFHSRSIFRTVSVDEKSPSRILEKVNDQILRDAAVADGMFITYICGLYDAKSRRFTLSNAGHFPPLFYSARNKAFQQTRTSGIPIGILEKQIYPEEHIDLSAGDILVFYTDGVIEAKNHEGQMFGIESLMRLIEENKQKSASDIFLAINQSIQSFVADASQYDDMTLLVLKSLS